MKKLIVLVTLAIVGTIIGWVVLVLVTVLILQQLGVL